MTKSIIHTEPPLLYSFFLGGVAHALELSIGGHILDRIKVHCEATGTSSHLIKNVQHLMKQEDTRFFFKGFRWNLSLAFFKGSHGWMINNVSNRLVNTVIPENKKNSLLFPLSVSLTTATIEGTCVITPLERLKTIEMTARTEKTSSVMMYLKKHGLPFFFTGLPSVIFRQFVTWASYLCFYDRYKSIVETHQATDSISLTNKISVAALTGSSVCLVNAPIDFYKTHKQMLDSLPNKRALDNIRHLFARYGFLAFYANLRVKILRSSFSCVVIISTLDYANALPLSMRIGK